MQWQMRTVDIRLVIFLKCKGICKTSFFIQVDKIKNDCHTIKGKESFVTKKQKSIFC